MTTDVLTRDAGPSNTTLPSSGDTTLSVLIVNGSFRLGGAEQMAIALANALVQDGLRVFYASAGGPLRDNLDARVKYLPTANPNHAPSRVTHELLLYLRHHQFDVVHSHGGTCGLVSSVAIKASKAPCARILTHHSRVFTKAPRWISGPVMKRCADHFIAISRDKQTDLERLGIARDRITLIPNFVDVQAIVSEVESTDTVGVRASLDIPADAKVLVMASRVIAGKRFDNFVRIAGETARRCPDTEVHAVVVGDGPQLGHVRRIAAKEGAPARVHFPGYQRNVVPYLAAADVVAFPSEHPEVLPMFLIESSAAGCAIVCSDIPGNREVVTDGETALVARGVDAFASAVSGLLRNPAAGARLGAAARERARREFDRTRAARRTIEVYCSALGARETR